MVKLPPPFLGTESLGPTPTPPADGAAPLPGADPLLTAYDRPAPADQPGLPIGPDEVTNVIVALADVLAQLRGPHWSIEADECALLSPPLARQLAKPDSAFTAWLAAHADPLLIALGASLIVVPRAVVEVQVIRYRRQLAQHGDATLHQEVPSYAVPDYGPSDADAVADAGGGGEAEPYPGAGVSAGLDGARARPTDPGQLASALAALAER